MDSSTPFHEILERARSGNREALQSLLEPHLPALTAFVRLRSRGLRNRESCADLVQSACRNALERLNTLRSDSEENFEHWLFAIALNKIRSAQEHHHAEKRDVKREVDVVNSTVDDVAVLTCYATMVTPSQHAIAREEIERIESAFDGLSEEYREVISLARVASLSTKEIAELMDRSEGAVRMLLARALSRLARIVE